MKPYVGTSGYSYKEWKGPFYPEDLPERGMLSYYSLRFSAVEINNTFYRMPTPALLESWGREVPPHFRFALKAPQSITHVKRLRDTGEAVSYLFEAAASLRETRGPVLFQLPPQLKKDLPLLRDFLAQLPPQHRSAFEFRHDSWFEEEVFSLLARYGAALCVADAEGDLKVPFVATADFGYLRLRRVEYDAAQLKGWVKRVQGEKWREVYVFFKHEEKGTAPHFARRFLELCAAPP